MSMLEQYFLEALNVKRPQGYILNEEIYRRPETSLIDADFKVILDWFSNPDNIYKVRKNKYDVDDHFKKELTDIEKNIRSLLGAKIILRFDRASKFDKLSFGMCVFPSNEEMHNKIQSEIEGPKKGFYLYECNNSTVFMDFYLIQMCLDYKLTSKVLTAVLLHELGHKVYVKKQCQIRQNGNTRNVLGDEATKQVKKGNIVKSGGALLMFAGLPIMAISGRTDNKVGKVASVAVGLISMILGSGLGIVGSSLSPTLLGDTTTYVESEALSDLLAVKYGYGYEIAKTMDIFYAKFKRKVDGVNKVLKFFNKNANNLSADKLRRDEVKRALQAELSDPNNSAAEKESIKNIIKAIEEMQIKNESDETIFKLFGESCQLLSEVITFRSSDMKTIKFLLHSKQVLDKVYKLTKKGWRLIHKADELNTLNMTIVENKIKEMAEISVTNTVETSAGDKVDVGIKHSKTKLKLRNIVLMEVLEYLCIVEGMDNGRILSVTAIFLNDSEQIKFVKFQKALLKV